LNLREILEYWLQPLFETGSYLMERRIQTAWTIHPAMSKTPSTIAHLRIERFFIVTFFTFKFRNYTF
jgi:hypothetical protein